MGGSVETGYPGVGALTGNYGGFYMGAFCTGVLVDPYWVLTAAHCLTEHEGISITANMTKFYVGNNAEDPSSGQFFQAYKFYLHPNYNDINQSNDIALVQLSEAASGVTPYAMNFTAMDGSWNGQSVKYVGFGVDNGVAETGGGIKRSASIPLTYFEQWVYYSNWSGSMVCFGDSGGPGFRTLDGKETVIGINSAVGSTGSDPCGSGSSGVHTRVDAYMSWISSTMNVTPPNCSEHADMCVCPEACQSDGSCNNSVCQTLSCRHIYYCLYDCAEDDAGCQNECVSKGSAQGQAEFNALSECLYQHCESITDDEQYQQCAETNCQQQLDTCFPPGDLTCEQVMDCMYECPENDENCLMDCFDKGTKEAQDAYIAMSECFDEKCGSITDNDAWLDCVYENCVSELQGCFPPANCDITGGGCGAGKACYPSLGGAMDCFPSEDKGAGEACNPNPQDTLSCADGLICLDDSICHDFCKSQADCPGGQTCELPIFEGISDIGACIGGGSCTDNDQDGHCVPQDCDDSNAAVNPGAAEACNDGVDNNCDGQTDENCGTPGTDTGPGADTGPGTDTGPGADAGPSGDTTTSGSGGGGGCAHAPFANSGAGWLLLAMLCGLVAWVRRKRLLTRSC